MEGTDPPAVVSSALRVYYYEFISELNDSCQLDFTPSEIMALVNQVDYCAPENCDHSSSIHDLDDQNNITEYSSHSVIQVDSSPLGHTSKYGGVCSNDGAETQRKTSPPSSSQSQSAPSRSVFVKRQLGCLIVKLTSREHLALRHYNNVEGCFEKLNSVLSSRNVQIYLSNKKPRLTVKGSSEFDSFSRSLLTLIHLAGYWWDHRKDANKSKSSLQLSEEIKSCSTKPLSKVASTSNQNSRQSAVSGVTSEPMPVDVAENANRLPEEVKAVKTDRTGQSNCKQVENFIMLDSSPEELLAQQCPHLCKDFPDCFNTIPDQIVSNSCEVVYFCQNSKHDLFISADQQLDIVKKLNLMFEGVKISLLRKFAAFHILPTEGVDPQFAISAISKLVLVVT